jgi:diacylglycerol kinase (ATP)
LVEQKCHKYSIALDDTQFSEELLILIGAASENTGGGINIAPNAKTNLDQLNVLFATNLGRASAISLLFRALSGKHLTHPKVHDTVHKKCHVTCDADNFWASLVYGDGEYMGVLPISLQIGSKPLRVLIPNAIG